VIGGQRRRWHHAAVVVAAAVVFVLHALAWSVDSGRAGNFQLLAYLNMWDRQPLLPALIGYPPIAPLIFGPLTIHLGVGAVELFLAMCFIVCASCVYQSATMFGDRIGLTVTAAVLLHPLYGALFHKTDTDVVFAAALAGWLLFALRRAASQDLRTYVWHGAIVFLLILIRPSNQAFLAFALYPLVSRLPLAQRVVRAAAFVATVAALLVCWSAANLAWYGQSGGRFTNATLLYGLMMNTRIVQPDNGPASAALAQAVQEELLPHEPYRSRHIDVTTFFATTSFRGWEDLLWVSDRRWGWATKYRILRDVAVEAIRRNPGQYVLDVTKTFLHTFILRQDYRVRPREPAAADAAPAVPATATTENASIPAAAHSWVTTSRDGRFEGSGLERLRPLTARLDEAVQPLLAYRRPIPAFSDGLNLLRIPYIPMIVALVIGVLALPFLGVIGDGAVDRERVLSVLFVASVALLGLSSALQPPTLEYRLPLDPVFILTAAVGGRAILRGRRVLASAALVAAPHASSKS
jgi:hypothetical protein